MRPGLKRLFQRVTHSDLYTVIAQWTLVIWMVWTRIGHLRPTCCWKPVVNPADPLTALYWGCIGSAVFLITVQATTTETGLCTRWNLYFMPSLGGDFTLSLSTYPPTRQRLWPYVKDVLAQVSYCGRWLEKGGRDKVVWNSNLAPCWEGNKKVGSLASSFVAGFCTPGRIVFFNSSIQKGGNILKFTWRHHYRIIKILDTGSFSCH